MNAKILFPRLAVVISLLALAGFPVRAAESSPATNTIELPRTDANGNPLRRAPTGHVSNYNELKVGNFTLPDLLLLQNGKPISTANTAMTSLPVAAGTYHFSIPRQMIQ